MQQLAPLPVLALDNLDPVQAYKSAVLLRRGLPETDFAAQPRSVLVSLPAEIAVDEWDPEVLVKHVSLARLEVAGVVKDNWVSQLFADLTGLPVIDPVAEQVGCLADDVEAEPPACVVAPARVLGDVMPEGPAGLAARLAADIARITKAPEASTVDLQASSPADAFAADEITRPDPDAFEPVVMLAPVLELVPLDVAPIAELSTAIPDASSENSDETTAGVSGSNPEETAAAVSIDLGETALNLDAPSPELTAEPSFAPEVNATQIEENATVQSAVVEPDIADLDTADATSRADAAEPSSDPVEQTATQQTIDQSAAVASSVDSPAVADCGSCRDRALLSGEDLVPTEPAGQAHTYAGRLRAGQVCQSLTGDLILVGAVGTGALVRAVGNVHVYGRASGALKAGQRGDTTARIYVADFNAQIVDIAGRYQSFETVPEDLKGRTVEIWLENDTLFYTAV